MASTDNGLQTKLQKIEEFAMKRLRDIQGLLGGDVLRAKSELMKHCTDITLTPKREQLRRQRRLESIGRTFGVVPGPGLHYAYYGVQPIARRLTVKTHRYAEREL